MKTSLLCTMHMKRGMPSMNSFSAVLRKLLPPLLLSTRSDTPMPVSVWDNPTLRDLGRQADEPSPSASAKVAPASFDRDALKALLRACDFIGISA